jgi:hypothetical protein
MFYSINPNNMKLFLLIFAVLLSPAVSSLAQQNKAGNMSKEELLNQSKKEKTTAFVLLGAGAVATGVGAALIGENFCIFGCTDSADRALAVGTGLFVGGGLAMLASIPVFISSSQKSKRAYRIQAVNEPMLIPKEVYQGPRSYPALRVSFPLSR